MSLKALHAAGLLLAGFIGGIVGISVYNGSDISGALTPATRIADASSDACVPDESDEEDIFFLSCGGIF